MLPFKDESTIKAYLLHASQRQAMLTQQATSTSLVKGAVGAISLLRERSFLCLHYRLGDELQLMPCSASPEEGM